MKTNASQQKAIESEGKNLLIVAGPGTGKTHTLTLRIIQTAQHLLSHQKILAITFTNKAARQMKERLTLFSKTTLDRVFVGTFHGFCLRFLRKAQESTGLPQDFSLCVNALMKEQMSLLWKDLNEKERNQKLKEFSLWKSTRFFETKPEEIKAYDEFLRAHGLLDYDDVLLETYEFFKKDKKALQFFQDQFPFVFVDEYQDVNGLQNALLKIMVGSHSRITAIGDPYQSIYSFRGADMTFFKNFSQDFKNTEMVHLRENYRSSKNLVQASTQVIEKQSIFDVPEPVARIYEQGQIVFYVSPTDKAEAEYVVASIEKLIGGTSSFSHNTGRVNSYEQGEYSFGDIAVLYRLNFQNKLLEEAFQRSGMPYQISGEKSLMEEDGISEIVHGIKQAAKEKNFYVKEYIDTLMGRDPWKQKSAMDKDFVEKIEKLKKIALRTENVNEFLDDLLLQRAEDTGGERGEKVSLMTIHASKGLEFPVVFILGCEEGILPYEGNEDKEEERRLFYVGMTRAKKKIFFLSSAKRKRYGKMKSQNPSPFLQDIEQSLLSIEKGKNRKPLKGRQEKQYDLF